jgi:transaldolase
MLKVPATRAGIPAIEQLVSEGININVTLIFGADQYEAVAEAYLAGLERRSHAQGQGAPLDRAASVASFFVSRIDARVDEALENKGEAAQALKGRIAIAHAKVAYARFREIFAGQRWERLAGQGGRVQRVLWGSTSTKNPVYPDTYYVDNLIAPHTVNTVPSHTLHAFLDHGKVAGTLESGIEAARADLARLSDLGIDLHHITQKLLDDGVQAFIDSFEGLLAGIAHKRDQLRSNQA